MSVAALVCDSNQADHVVSWAARFALARNSDLIIYYLTTADAFRQTKVSVDGEERFIDTVRESIDQAVENVVRTRKVRKGRLGRYQVSVRHITDPDPVASVIRRIRVETPDLFVGAVNNNHDDHQLPVSRQVANRVVCDSVVLYFDDTRSKGTSNISVVYTGNRNDRDMLNLVVQSADSVSGVATVYRVDSEDGSSGKTSGTVSEHLNAGLNQLQLEGSESLQVKSIRSKDPAASIADKGRKQDLILVNSDQESRIPTILESTKTPLVGVFRLAPRLAAEQGWVRALSMLPRINPADFAEMYERLQAGSRWNADFMVMLSLASAIATNGLLQNSPAVIIGSMLLAPLMTPMIGLGLALNRGNGKAAYSCFRAISRGFLASLVISAVIGFITPGSDLTPEVLARTEPNILDLLIAVFSGMAAAYAVARPGLAGSIAGVAIATALVPPCCAAGIAISYGQFPAALGAMWLLAANILAIILAAAFTFRAMGLSDISAIGPRKLWVNRVVIGLLLCSVVVALPLIGSFIQQVKRGETAPIALTVTNETRRAIMEKIEADEGISLLLIGRPGIPREEDPVDVGVIITSERPLPKSYADELAEIVRKTMDDSELHVRVECVAAGWQE